MSEKRSEFSEMQDVAECGDLIKQLVPREHRSMKQWIAATAVSLGWSYTRTKDIWYGDARRIDGWEKDTLKAAKLQKETRKIAHDYALQVERIERLQKALAAVGAQLDRGQVAHLERELSRSGDVDRAGDRRRDPRGGN